MAIHRSDPRRTSVALQSYLLSIQTDDVDAYCTMCAEAQDAQYDDHFELAVEQNAKHIAHQLISDQLIDPLYTSEVHGSHVHLLLKHGTSEQLLLFLDTFKSDIVRIEDYVHDDHTPLDSCFDEAKLKVLLEYGADPNYRADGIDMSPYQSAILFGWTNQIKLYLAHGHQPDPTMLAEMSQTQENRDTWDELCELLPALKDQSSEAAGSSSASGSSGRKLLTRFLSILIIVGGLALVGYFMPALIWIALGLMLIVAGAGIWFIRRFPA